MKILIKQFTDPFCTWSWGSEPVVKKLAYKLEDVEIEYIMSGLVEDIRDYFNSKAGMDKVNKAVNQYFLKAARGHGMPVKEEGLAIFSEEDPSSFMESMAFKAGQVQDQKKAKFLLRRIREESLIEGRDSSSKDLLADLAEEVGLDKGLFLEDMLDGRAEEDFNKDRAYAKLYGIKALPSYLIEAGGKKLFLEGYQVYEAFKIAITDYAGLAVKERDIDRSPDGIFDFIRRYKSLADKEVSYVFDLSDEEFDHAMEVLTDRGMVKREKGLIRPVE